MPKIVIKMIGRIIFLETAKIKKQKKKDIMIIQSVLSNLLPKKNNLYLFINRFFY